MTSNRPYLIRALHEWVIDNGLTPQLLVDTTVEGLEIPPQLTQDDQIILNISYQATGNLEIGNEWILFAARFSGVSHQLAIPIDAVRAIFVRENDWRMLLPPEQSDRPEPPDPPGHGPSDSPSSDRPQETERRPSHSHLKVVK